MLSFNSFEYVGNMTTQLTNMNFGNNKRPLTPSKEKVIKFVQENEKIKNVSTVFFYLFTAATAYCVLHSASGTFVFLNAAAAFAAYDISIISDNFGILANKIYLVKTMTDKKSSDQEAESLARIKDIDNFRIKILDEATKGATVSRLIFKCVLSHLI